MVFDASGFLASSNTKILHTLYYMTFYNYYVISTQGFLSLSEPSAICLNNKADEFVTDKRTYASPSRWIRFSKIAKKFTYPVDQPIKWPASIKLLHMLPCLNFYYLSQEIMQKELVVVLLFTLRPCSST